MSELWQAKVKCSRCGREQIVDRGKEQLLDSMGWKYWKHLFPKGWWCPGCMHRQGLEKFKSKVVM